MDFVSHRVITLILFGRSVIQHICLFDVYLFVPFHSMALNLLYLKMFNPLNLYEAVKLTVLVVQKKFMQVRAFERYIPLKAQILYSTALFF